MKLADRLPWLCLIFGGVLLLNGGGGSPFAPDSPPPIAEAGLRVLVAYETDPNEMNKYAPGEFAALTATAPGSVRAYCAEHCVKGKDSKTPEAVFLDDDSEISRLPAYWAPAWDRRPRQSPQLPWLVVSNGKTGFEGPMPDTEAEVLAILQKIGGQ